VGATLIDTAKIYGQGQAEHLLGRAIASHRHQVVIADKVAAEHLRLHDIRAAFEGSCRRFGTDYIDIYFIHWPNIDVPLADTIGELERLRQAGNIRAIGVSNFTADELAEAGRYGRIDVLQPPYSLFWRFSEQAEVPYCREHAIGIMTYSSLAQGLLTGLLTAETEFAAGDQRPTTMLFQPDHYARCLHAVAQLRPIAARYGKTVAQLALNWLLAQPGVSVALVGARTVGEIEENAGAVGWALAADDLAAVDRIGRTVTDALPPYPDMFGTWRGWDLQQRRYERSGRLV
jgi:myo-inositol catabolism protein IolS